MPIWFFIPRYRKKLVGGYGTSIQLRVRQPGAKQDKIATLERNTLLPEAPRVVGKFGNFLVPGSDQSTPVGLIKFDRFYSGCGKDILAILQYFDKMGIEGCIFDLRDNRGGDAQVLLNCAGNVTGSGTIAR